MSLLTFGSPSQPDETIQFSLTTRHLLQVAIGQCCPMFSNGNPTAVISSWRLEHVEIEAAVVKKNHLFTSIAA